MGVEFMLFFIRKFSVLNFHFPVLNFQINSYLCRQMCNNKFSNGNLERKKKLLWRRLENNGCAWSYVKKPKTIDDELLIEKSLLYLEFEELHKLNEIYPMHYLREVWRKRLVSQGAYYDIVNRLLAAMFFDIKNPDRYLKRYGKPRMEARA